MAAAATTVRVPANAYGARFPGWTNQIANMPDEKITDFNSFNLYIIDDVERGEDVVQGVGYAAQVEHENCCNEINNIFGQLIADFKVHSVRMEAGQNEFHFMQYFEREFAQYEEGDLIVIYYHGSAGGDNGEYAWQPRGPGPNTINAYNFICEANQSRASLWFILDCFIPTHFQKGWKRKDRMTEFSVAGHQMHDVNGRRVNGPQNFTATACRSLRAIVDTPRGKGRQSLHHIMSRDKRKCSTALRLWINRPDRRKAARVWRIFFDIEGLISTGSLQLRSCEITGRPTGEWAIGPDGGDDGDNGNGGNGNNGGGGGNGGDGDDSDSDSDDANAHNGNGDIGMPHRGTGGRLRRNGNDSGRHNETGNSVWERLGLDPRLDQDENVLNDPEAMRHVRKLKRHIGQVDAQPRNNSLKRSHSLSPTVTKKSFERPFSPFFDLDGLRSKSGDRFKREPSPDSDLEVVSFKEATKGSFKRAKREPSPDQDLEVLFYKRANYNIKREPSPDPDLEVLSHTKGKTVRVDLTDETVDLTNDSDPEWTLFVPQDDDEGFVL